MRLRARLSIAAACLFILFILFAESLFALVGPFLLALLMAAIIDPMVNRLERAGLSRAIGALMAIGALGVGAALGVWVLFVNLVREAEHFRTNLPEYARRMGALVEEWAEQLSSILAELPHPFDDALRRGAEQALQVMGDVATQMVARVGSLPSLFVIVAVMLTTTYFISRDKRLLGDFLFRLLPKGWRAEVRRIKTEITNGLLGFVRAQVILVAVSGCLAILGLLLFNVRYAWILGTLAGILDLVPMVGPSGVFIPLLLSLMAVADWTRAIGVLCVWLLILLVRQVLEPQVVGRHVGLHPVTSIAAIYLGGALMGINGILIGPIVAITLKAVCVVSLLPHVTKE